MGAVWGEYGSERTKVFSETAEVETICVCGSVFAKDVRCDEIPHGNQRATGREGTHPPPCGEAVARLVGPGRAP